MNLFLLIWGVALLKVLLKRKLLLVHVNCVLLLYGHNRIDTELSVSVALDILNKVGK
jgi:hypothetical protein